jgi:hypothetical protein
MKIGVNTMNQPKEDINLLIEELENNLTKIKDLAVIGSLACENLEKSEGHLNCEAQFDAISTYIDITSDTILKIKELLKQKKNN